MDFQVLPHKKKIRERALSGGNSVIKIKVNIKVVEFQILTHEKKFRE